MWVASSLKKWGFFTFYYLNLREFTELELWGGGSKKLLKTNLIRVVKGVPKINKNSILSAYLPEENKIITLCILRTVNTR